MLDRVKRNAGLLFFAFFMSVVGFIPAPLMIWIWEEGPKVLLAGGRFLPPAKYLLLWGVGLGIAAFATFTKMRDYRQLSDRLFHAALIWMMVVLIVSLARGLRDGGFFVDGADRIAVAIAVYDSRAAMLALGVGYLLVISVGFFAVGNLLESRFVRKVFRTSNGAERHVIFKTAHVAKAEGQSAIYAWNNFDEAAYQLPIGFEDHPMIRAVLRGRPLAISRGTLLVAKCSLLSGQPVYSVTSLEPFIREEVDAAVDAEEVSVDPSVPPAPPTQTQVTSAATSPVDLAATNGAGLTGTTTHKAEV